MNDGVTDAQREQFRERFRKGIGSRDVPPAPDQAFWDDHRADMEDPEYATAFAEAAVALGCPWCKTGAPFGHECEVRDRWLDVEDSELD